jgi:hypothetical protein
MTIPKGHKKRLVRQCLTELGVETSFGAAKKWFQKHHKLSLADATFYHVRKDMQVENLRLVAAATKVVKVITENGISKPFVSPQVQGIVEAVLTAQKLVEKLGKEETRKLIDLL